MGISCRFGEGVKKGQVTEQFFHLLEKTHVHAVPGEDVRAGCTWRLARWSGRMADLSHSPTRPRGYSHRSQDRGAAGAHINQPVKKVILFDRSWFKNVEFALPPTLSCFNRATKYFGQVNLNKIMGWAVKNLLSSMDLSYLNYRKEKLGMKSTHKSL